MLVFFNEIYNSINNNTQVDAIYLDFKKAFERVAHQELFFKLWSLGITGGTWRWLKAYLTDSAHDTDIIPRLQIGQDIWHNSPFEKEIYRFEKLGSSSRIQFSNPSS